ncbi:MAG: 3-deoxy-manno-octulosonate cytidylyltransferase [Syntrophorhabdaceae bacterium]
MHIIAVIPARMASTRFPGKPLASICGLPMLGHVFYRTKMSELLNDVYFATCDTEIADYAATIGAKAIMTKDTHERASDRCAEALLKIEAETGKKVDVLVMVQGDEPMLRPSMLDELIRPVLENPGIAVTNLMARIDGQQEFNNSNVVKVVVDKEDYALYFSREPIPSKRKYNGELPMRKQLGFILFQRSALLDYTDMEPTPLEIIESVDMNRFLEHGYKIKMVETVFKTTGVDVPEDIASVEGSLKDDEIMKRYLPARS